MCVCVFFNMSITGVVCSLVSIYTEMSRLVKIQKTKIMKRV